jgi:hypothetical protein
MSLPLAGTTITARLPSFLLLPPPQPPVDPEVQVRGRGTATGRVALPAGGSIWSVPSTVVNARVLHLHTEAQPLACRHKG